MNQYDAVVSKAIPALARDPGQDLYVAEVYDVERTGETKNAYGRVFYTKEKPLIFYAYDLDQQPGVKNASTFRAWVGADLTGNKH